MKKFNFWPFGGDKTKEEPPKEEPPKEEEVKEIIVDKQKIQEILFHEGDKLLLDEVRITKTAVVGSFKVTDKLCEGHEPVKGMRVHRGVDIIEMAFQLLGVFLFHYRDPEISEMLEGKKLAAREVTSAKFSGFVRPGETVCLEMRAELSADELGGVVLIEGGRMVAKVGGKKKATIGSVSLVAFDPSRIEQES